jgi:hypothetical protein
MSLHKLWTTGPHRPQGEGLLDLINALPDWLVWAAAGAIGAFALAAVARALLTCLDMDGG